MLPHGHPSQTAPPSSSFLTHPVSHVEATSDLSIANSIGSELYKRRRITTVPSPLITSSHHGGTSLGALQRVQRPGVISNAPNQSVLEMMQQMQGLMARGGVQPSGAQPVRPPHFQTMNIAGLPVHIYPDPGTGKLLYRIATDSLPPEKRNVRVTEYQRVELKRVLGNLAANYQRQRAREHDMLQQRQELQRIKSMYAKLHAESGSDEMVRQAYADEILRLAMTHKDNQEIQNEASKMLRNQIIAAKVSLGTSRVDGNLNRSNPPSIVPRVNVSSNGHSSAVMQPFSGVKVAGTANGVPSNPPVALKTLRSPLMSASTTRLEKAEKPSSALQPANPAQQQSDSVHSSDASVQKQLWERFVNETRKQIRSNFYSELEDELQRMYRPAPHGDGRWRWNTVEDAVRDLLPWHIFQIPDENLHWNEIPEDLCMLKFVFVLNNALIDDAFARDVHENVEKSLSRFQKIQQRAAATQGGLGAPNAMENIVIHRPVDLEDLYPTNRLGPRPELQKKSK